MALCSRYPGVTLAVDSVGHYLAICETIDAAHEIEIDVRWFNSTEV